MRKAASRPGERSRAVLLYELTHSPLVLAQCEATPLDLDAEGRVRADTSVTLLSSVGPNGHCLLAFTGDLDKCGALRPDCGLRFRGGLASGRVWVIG